MEREVVGSFAVQLGKGNACEEPVDRNSLWCLGVVLSSVLLHSLLLTIPSVLGCNSRNKKVALLSHSANTF